MKRLLLLLSTGLLVLSLSACQNDVMFELLGQDPLILETGTPYTEFGYMARIDGKDVTEHVTIESDVNADASGDYTVTYTLDYDGVEETLTRLVQYREEGCAPIEDTNLTVCESYWTAYLFTAVKLTIYYEGDTYHDVAYSIFDNVENILEDFHKLSTKYDDFGINNIYAINQDPTTTHVLDHRLFDMIQFTLEHQEDVNNLFNIALNPVLELWSDARDACDALSDSCAIPSMVDLLAADAFTDPSGIVLDEQAKSITMEAGMSIDLGGVSKGYISGKIIEYLDALDLRYLLNNGTSNISIGGTHPTRENGKFLLAVTDPSNPGAWYAEVFLSDGDQLVTSGDYQKYFVVDGTLYHHIINPLTLMPERYARSVSIVTDDPALADLYSTAIFNMPIDEGLAFVNGIDNLEGIWYTMDDTVVMSDHFEANYVNRLYVPIAD
jgi:thiamine biosynthesis lipoprotein